jgi:hypothetical protein
LCLSNKDKWTAQRLARARFPKRWPVLQQAQQALRGPWLRPIPAA